ALIRPASARRARGDAGRSDLDEPPALGHGTEEPEELLLARARGVEIGRALGGERGRRDETVRPRRAVEALHQEIRDPGAELEPRAAPAPRVEDAAARPRHLALEGQLLGGHVVGSARDL